MQGMSVPDTIPQEIFVRAERWRRKIILLSSNSKYAQTPTMDDVGCIIKEGSELLALIDELVLGMRVFRDQLEDGRP